MAASMVRAQTTSVGGMSSGYNMASSGVRSPTSSICSFAGSVSSDSVCQQNKYLMKTLCLSKKCPVLPGKAEYAKLLTCGLGKFVIYFIKKMAIFFTQKLNFKVDFRTTQIE